MKYPKLTIKGQAKPKGSVVPFYTKGGLRVRPSSKYTSEWMKLAKKEIKRLWKGPLITGPIELDITFLLSKPKTTTRKFATGRFDGDGDKLDRAGWDAMTGTVYVDDSQVVKWAVFKGYAEDCKPRVIIIVRDYEGA